MIAPYTLSRRVVAVMMWGYWGGAGSWLDPILMLVFWLLVIGGLVALVHFFARPQAVPDAAHAILRERFARSEISREELVELQRGLDAE